jgi:hypothetical protein
MDARLAGGLSQPTVNWHLAAGTGELVTTSESEDSWAQHLHPTICVIGHTTAAGVGVGWQLQTVCPRLSWARRTVAANIKRPIIFTLHLKNTLFSLPKLILGSNRALR